MQLTTQVARPPLCATPTRVIQQLNHSSDAGIHLVVHILTQAYL